MLWTLPSIISPGVGMQGGSAGDTIRAGAEYVIVGRSIYQSDDPLDTNASMWHYKSGCQPPNLKLKLSNSHIYQYIFNI